MSWDKTVGVIIHSDSTGSLYTGDIVTGTVTIELRKETKLKRESSTRFRVPGIDMHIMGISQAKWVRSSPTVPYMRIYTEKKKVLFVKTSDIFNNIGNSSKIPAGVYCYPFHFFLPDDLPSTFQSSIACVRYFVKISSKPKQFRVEVPFKVIAKVNINHIHEMLVPYTHEFERNVNGKVAVQVKTYSGIAPRQNMPFEITIHNEKNVIISKIRVALLQNRRYTVKSGYATEEKKIASIEYKKIVNARTEICYFKLDIPPALPSSINTTDPMIEISYVIRVEICFRYHFNIYEDFPVTMATIPVIHNDF